MAVMANLLTNPYRPSKSLLGIKAGIIMTVTGSDSGATFQTVNGPATSILKFIHASLWQ